ncbi:efflux RND transporter permease subunit [Arenimonas terrae]|uniref:Efflux RND transporter permease subunit n=1 Tax=Arenimonas terrae TaxID=2546226 RepID=A0A5C4RTU7_9GAMM|nr:efflux RND transporter permease subunit [Arenimonas terrae]TNJ34600.1 efflux RND transporter permease subunit [Arenimonas terrae]
MSIVELSLRRPVSVIMFFVSMIVIGLIASFRLPLEQFPALNFPGIYVDLPYPGSTPQEVERSIVRPVEEALSTLEGIKRLEANARADGGGVFIEFSDWGRDVEVLASEARERIDAVRSDLPDDFQRYQVLKFSTADEPMLRVRLGGNRDLTGAYDLIESKLARRLERVPGVARVDISGAPPSEIEIAIDPDRLSAHGLSLNELASRLQAVNFSVSAGMVDDGDRRLRVQPIGELRDLRELRELVVGANGLRLEQIADVRLKAARVDFGRRLEGQPAVGLDIFRERNANLVEAAKSTMEEIYRIVEEPDFDGIEIILISDQGKNVTNSLWELTEAGIIGLVLSVAVLFFFLRHWPSTLMVSLAIPICFVMTLGFMHFLGVTLNVLTMMGLLLAVGMLVDNAVVVVESIYQERERNPGNPAAASIFGTKNVAIALSAGTLCHCIVFVPNIFGETNQISIFMLQIAVTITVSLLASWLVAISLIPMLSARMKTPPAATARSGVIARMQDRYATFLAWTLRHRGASVLGIILISAVSLLPIGWTQKDMFYQEPTRELEMYYQWNGAYSLEQVSDEVLRVEQWLDANRERLQIQQIYSWFSEQGWAGTRITLISEGSKLKDPSEVQEEIRKGMPRSARATVGFRGGGQQQGGGEDQIQVSLVGDSSEQLKVLAESLIPQLARQKALRDVRVDTGDVNSELAISVDRERALGFGFSADEVARYVGIALRGTPLREFRRGETEVPVWVRFDGSEDFGIEDLSALSLRTPSGENIPLLSVVRVNVQSAATQVYRQNRQTMLNIQANLADGTTLPDARKAMEEVLAAATLPPGYRYAFDGAFRQNDEAGAQMMINLVLALVMIYVVMAAVFESLLFPAAIMSSIVFSIFGVFWLFWMTGTVFTIMAFIGILVLMGVVVNNGIVMVEHINILRRSGMDRTAALVQGSRDRLRPILMTMGTAILGMVPIALSSTQMAGDGPPYYPMARAIAGGLAFSTLVSLLFLPTIYAILDDMSAFVSSKFGRARELAPLAPSADAAAQAE